MPGFTKLADPALGFAPDLLSELHSFIMEVREEVATPLTCEPPILEDLLPRVSGVIAGSPADLVGIRPGDVLAEVDNLTMTTRVEAFNAVYKATNPMLSLVCGNNHQRKTQLVKNRRKPSGLVMDYDLHPNLCEEIFLAVRSRRATKALLLTGAFAADIMRKALVKFNRGEEQIQVQLVPNRYFGGSIQAAGLLTVADFASAIRGLAKDSQPDLILLPPLAFDKWGKDLTGRSFLELEEMFGVEVVVI
jgi:hypothetical protein